MNGKIHKLLHLLVEIRRLEDEQMKAYLEKKSLLKKACQIVESMAKKDYLKECHY